jgi:hypothetical protein
MEGDLIAGPVSPLPDYFDVQVDAEEARICAAANCPPALL